MINNIDELEALLKLCRKQGVTEITLQGSSIKFGDLPEKKRKRDGEAEEADEPVLPQGLTPEQLMFFSAGGGIGGQPP